MMLDRHAAGVRWGIKYAEVARTNLRSALAYVWDVILSTIYLAIIMFVFVQLWRVTYASSPAEAFAGYTLPEIIWYLVGTEAIVTSLPRITRTLEAEVKNGDLAVRLNKPYSYLLFHFSAGLGEGLLRFAFKLLVGGLAAYVLVGGFRFYWAGVPVMLLVYLITGAMHFCYNATIGLAAFWMEDISGLYLVFDRLKWILGGMLLPVEVYPDAIRRVVEVLPFRHMIAGPARLFIKFSWADALALLQSQAVWLAVFATIAAAVYRLGVRRVDVNGG